MAPAGRTPSRSDCIVASLRILAQDITSAAALSSQFWSSANTGTQASTDTAAAAVSTCSFLLACIPITYLLKSIYYKFVTFYYGVMLSSLRFHVKKKMVPISDTIFSFLSFLHYSSGTLGLVVS